MKKILILVICLIFISGCNNSDGNNDNKIIKEENNNNNIIQEYIDKNPIKIGIYDNNILVKDFETEFIPKTDLAVFNILYTNEELIEYNSTKNNWKKYYASYENINNYKTGFYISFEANGTFHEKTILNSDNTFFFYPYMFIYLYDDVNQLDYAWYSHVEPQDENENTIFSSIKIYLNDCDNITSPITLTAFTYNSTNDFDQNGKYRGNSYYTINISNKID